MGLYKGSHALIIGISDYTAGWPKLESVPYEINKVEAALKKQGFHVVKVMNPTSDELNAAFEYFIDTYGFDVGNRLQEKYHSVKIRKKKEIHRFVI